jgi:GTP pyrophosphokinase
MEQELFKTIDRKQEIFDNNARDLILRAFIFARAKHKGQKRYSGEDYIVHPVSVASMLADKDFDVSTVAAALLHDTIEDTSTCDDELIAEFGYDIANLVMGVTKISSIPIKDKVLFFSEDDVYKDRIDNYRKLLIATGKDIRVMVLKLYDRLHNVMTLKHVPAAKRKYYAKESIEIYAKIAERIGLNDVRSKIEDASFRFAYPHEHKRIESILKELPEYDIKVIKNILPKIKKSLETSEVEYLDVSGRLKHKLSIYNKLKNQYAFDFSKLYDLFAFRIIVNNVDDCYKALGVIHGAFKPVPGRIYDFIANPKENGYRSLHTTVSDEAGRFFEIQIRTSEMHHICEFGMAAHWHYKDISVSGYGHQLRLNLKDWNQEIEKIRALSDSNEALHYMRGEMFSEKIFVATPKGEIVKLPKNSTPIDFAFKIHTNLGLTCSGARVNSKIVTLDTKLRNGDIVEIITSNRAKPSRDWLKLAKTDGARQKISQFLRGQNREHYIAVGRDIMRGYLMKYGFSMPDEAQSDALLSNSTIPYNDFESALAAVGQRYFTPTKLAKVIIPNFTIGKSKKHVTGSRKTRGSKVLSGISYSYAKCCEPKSGDDLIGYVTKKHILKIHKKECKWLEHADKSRIIEV